MQAIAKMNTELPAILANFEKQHRILRPCGGPVVFQEDNFFKIVLLLWFDEGAIIMGMIGNSKIEGADPCDHKMGYESSGAGLVCKGCGQPLG